MIEIDIESHIPESVISFLSDDFIGVVLDDLAAAARAKWIRLAQQTLDSSKRDYINGIQEIEGTGDVRWVSLVGWLANAVEQGIDPYDMRETLLGEGKGKRAKDGHRYRAIPFRHQTPGSEGQAGLPMGARYGPMGPQSLAWAEGVMDKGQAAKLGKRIYAQAKQLERGGRLRTSETRRKGFVQVPKLAPWHKSDIYRGMIRNRAPYEKVNQTGGYVTFRTISEKVSEGWIHPGIMARRLAPQVEQFIERIAAAAIETAWKNAVGGG